MLPHLNETLLPHLGHLSAEVKGAYVVRPSHRHEVFNVRNGSSARRSEPVLVAVEFEGVVPGV